MVVQPEQAYISTYISYNLKEITQFRERGTRESFF